jgi:hypothetical protein
LITLFSYLHIGWNNDTWVFFFTNIDIPLQTPYTFESHLWKRYLKVGYLYNPSTCNYSNVSQAMRRNELQNDPLLISHNSRNATYDTTMKLTSTKSNAQPSTIALKINKYHLWSCQGGVQHHLHFLPHTHLCYRWGQGALIITSNLTLQIQERWKCKNDGGKNTHAL